MFIDRPKTKSSFLTRIATGGSFLALIAASLVPIPANAYSTSVSGANTTLTFGYEGSIETFTIPDNVSEITITVAGGESGRGGSDYGTRPAKEGFKGVVTGTVPVSAGQVISVAVGEAGNDSSRTGCSGGVNAESGDSFEAVGGRNPISGKYAGGNGGAPGPNGCSGYGGGGWAMDASLKLGESVTSDGWTITVKETGAFGDVVEVKKN